MGRPQDQELQRSGNTPLDPDHVAAQAAHHPPAPVDEPQGGPVPVENQPGHRPDHDQDKPDLDAFAEKLGIEPEHDQADSDSDSAESDAAHGAVGTVMAAASSAREMASTAKELAEPVAHLVQDTVVRATKAFEERRNLAERVERLEAEVAELRARLDDTDR